jgi:hypothetical protein
MVKHRSRGCLRGVGVLHDVRDVRRESERFIQSSKRVGGCCAGFYTL